MNVLFLDFDGVVNIPKLVDNKWTMNMPEDNSVNSLEAIALLSKFCLSHKFSIVISSSWRSLSTWRSVLYNSGLDKRIAIVGKTPVKSDRNAEIEAFLSTHKIEKFFIIDDDYFDFSEDFVKNHLIFCDYNKGFTEKELKKLEDKLANG